MTECILHSVLFVCNCECARVNSLAGSAQFNTLLLTDSYKNAEVVNCQFLHLKSIPNSIFISLSWQVRRSRPCIPARHVSSHTAAPGSCCSMLRTPTAFAFTWKVNTAALSPHAWVGLRPWVGAQTVPLSHLFTASICLLTRAPSTSYASPAQAQVEGTVSEQWAESGPVAVLVGAIISVSRLRHPSLAPLHGTT